MVGESRFEVIIEFKRLTDINTLQFISLALFD
jgi:hypothetical protein